MMMIGARLFFLDFFAPESARWPMGSGLSAMMTQSFTMSNPFKS
jgi:hypothetical protein